MRDVRRPPPTPARTRRIAEDEQRRILLALCYDEARPVTEKRQQVAVAWLIAIETAMRCGEVLGLTWTNVRGKVAHLPKTKNGDARDVPLSKRAQVLLEKLKGLDALKCFTVSGASCDALFRRARDAAGVVGLTFHDSRREGTSRLSKKVDVLTLARITGHKDINELMTYYQTDMEVVADQIG
jgi:integrase